MKSLYESILSSTKSGMVNTIATDPKSFAQVMCGCKEDDGYYVTDNRLSIWRPKYGGQLVIDNSFPKLEFEINKLYCDSVHGSFKLIIKDWKTFRHNFGIVSSGIASIGGDDFNMGEHFTTIIDDPNFDADYWEFTSKFRFYGRIIFKRAKKIHWTQFPSELFGNIIFYTNGIGSLKLPFEQKHIKSIEIREK